MLLAMSEQFPKVVVIGGGAGTKGVLTGLKEYPLELCAVVNMSDNGGSTGLLREEFGVMPPGDIRQVIAALSENPEPVVEMFEYRYPDDTPLGGHSFGNLQLATAELSFGNFEAGLAVICKQMRVTGSVLPVTIVPHHLAMATSDGLTKGEYDIVETSLDPHEEPPALWLEPRASLNPRAHDAIMDADMVVIAPGDLYGSLAPALLVDGMCDVLVSTEARVVYISNLVNKPHQTAGFSPMDYAAELERIAGGQFIDAVVYHDRPIDESLMKKYSKQGESPVAPIGVGDWDGRRMIGADVIAEQVRVAAFDGPVSRSYVRHDPVKLARVLTGVLHDA